MLTMHIFLHPIQPVFLPCTDGVRLGLGGASLGNLFEAITDAQAHALVQAAGQSAANGYVQGLLGWSWQRDAGTPVSG